jgi:hypothetical protein
MDQEDFVFCPNGLLSWLSCTRIKCVAHCPSLLADLNLQRNYPFQDCITRAIERIFNAKRHRIWFVVCLHLGGIDLNFDATRFEMVPDDMVARIDRRA